MIATAQKHGVRIGEAAKQAGTTARTIRYYEEIGLLPASSERAGGAHRLYGEDDIERVKEILRLKSLLALSLDELKEVIEAEEYRQHLRTRFLGGEGTAAERREILGELMQIVDRQLELLQRRQAEMDELKDELTTRRRKIQRRLRELD